MAKQKQSTNTSSQGSPAGVQRTQANRKRRLERTLKKQPNNKQVHNALLEVGTARKAPKNPQWSHSAIRIARLLKEFGCRAPIELFSSNPKIQAQALQSSSSTRHFINLPEGKVSFSLAARAHDKLGNLVWN